MNAHKPTWRKPFGIFLILGLIALWAGIVASLADWLPPLWWPVQAIFFIAAGLVWVLPLRPLLRWMETGRFS